MRLLLGRTKQFATIPPDISSGTMCEGSMAHGVPRKTIGTEVLDRHPTTLFEVTAQEGQVDVVYSKFLFDRDKPFMSDHIRAIYCTVPHD
ncbi:MAG TPA: hypothetical protein VL261_08180 [Nitrospira sp.]|jgi:hypothetical protein|nr:hypothetical protein [Nitrospira sp.]